MIILDRNGRYFWSDSRTAGQLEVAMAARPARNQAIRRRLAARLQELVEQHMPEEVDFFCDWLYGDLSLDELWQKHVHATVETSAAQRASQVNGRTRRVLTKLQRLAEDDARSRILLDSLEGFCRIVNSKQVADEEDHR